MAFPVSKTLLDACVLGILSCNDTYGYQLTQMLKDVVSVSESTLYPVLRRLQKDGSLRTYDRSHEGRNRRYYSITETGRKQFRQYYEEWNSHKGKIDAILGGNEGTRS